MKIILAIAITCSLIQNSLGEIQQQNASKGRYHGVPLPMQEVYNYMRHVYKENNRVDSNLSGGSNSFRRTKPTEEEAEESLSFVTRIIQLKQSVVTVTSVTVVTATRYQTCTAVVPGTPQCGALGAIENETTQIPQNDDASSPTEQQEVNEETTNVPVLLPSCDCEENQGSAASSSARQRSPRLLKSTSQPTILLTRVSTVRITETSTVIDPATTVAIAYGGCLPTDAIVTTACVGV